MIVVVVVEVWLWISVASLEMVLSLPWWYTFSWMVIVVATIDFMLV